MAGWRDNISFILIDTVEAGNIGSSARALKNLGFSRLELVRPKKFPSAEAVWFAHGAEDVLSRVKVHRELADALKDKSVVIGTTRRIGKKRGPVYSVRDAAERIRRLSESNSVALLFGKEDRGLKNEEIAECQFMIRIPASSENPSFNLAHSVLIIAYELFSTGRVSSPLPATIDSQEVSVLFQRLREIMKMAGYAPKGIRDNEETIMIDLKRLISRASVTGREARMLHGILSQIEESLREKTGKTRS